MNYRWSLGTLIGFPLLIVATIILVILAVLLFRKSKTVSLNEDGRILWWCGIVTAFSALCMIVGTAWGMWPYSGEYHQWRETTGVVQRVDSRLLASDTQGGGTTQRFVVTFTDGRQRSCDDTRCALVKEQDELTLFCKRAWQWTGTPGYDCTYSVDHSPRND